MEKGAVVSFAVKGNTRVAVVEGPEGKSSLRVTDTFGNSLTVPSKDIEFSTTSFRLAEKSWLAPSGLASWVEAANSAGSAVDLATVWELLSAEGAGPYSLEEVAGCLWDSLSGERAFALYSALAGDRLFFKEKGGRYEARGSAQVEELRKQAAAVQNKERAQAELAARLHARLLDSTTELDADDLRRLEAVKKFALWGEEAADKNAALELLKLLSRPQTEAAAFLVLVELHLWHRHENLEVLRAGLSGF